MRNYTEHTPIVLSKLEMMMVYCKYGQEMMIFIVQIWTRIFLDRLSRSRDDSAAVHAKGDLRQLSVSRYYATCNCNNLVQKLMVATTYTSLNAMRKKKVGEEKKMELLQRDIFYPRSRLFLCTNKHTFTAYS